MIKLRDLAARAGQWLGLSQAPTAGPAHTGVIDSDRFDAMTWRDVQSQAAAIRDLTDDLAETHDYAADLVRDMFLGAYKAEPRIRDIAELDPARLPNRQVISCLLDTPDWDDLRRETVGDPYASAMAVLAQAAAVRRILDHAKDAQKAADQATQVRRDAEAAAQGVASALQAAGGQADDDGNVSDETAGLVERALAAAAQAGENAAQAGQKAAQALAAATPGMRAQARPAAAQAAENAREEAAMMAAWGISDGELQRMDFDTRARLAQRLRSGRLAQFTRLIGRFRQMAAAQRARRVENVPGEVVGIELGGDLPRLLPSELASLAVPGLRNEFIARLADGRAVVYQQRGETEAGQGAIIVAIDCSGSMGSPVKATGISGEAWAKAFALSMLDQAHTEHRDFAGILFSSRDQVKVFRFPAGQATRIADVITFAEHFWNGGTDFETPLSEAVKLLADEFDADGRQRGDIAMITDGICHVSEDWMRQWHEAKARLGYRMFGIRIGGFPGGILEALSDNVRGIEDLTDLTAATDIFRVV